MDVGTAVAVADVVGIVDLDEKVAGLGSYLEQAILKVALFRGGFGRSSPRNAASFTPDAAFARDGRPSANRTDVPLIGSVDGWWG